LAKLPNAEKAIIDAEKLQDYVLSFAHPVGRFKAAFFQKLGYSAENWEVFERCLRELILSHDVTKVEESRYGRKFIVEGPMVSPSGETVQIVTVWVILKKESIPRFVTAYPGGL
jgi:predicted transcriptional regulator